MAVLTATEQKVAYKALVPLIIGIGIPISKPDLLAAVVAADQWLDNNSASYNTALPAAARTSLTSKQKAALLNVVIAERYGVSS